MNEVLKALKNRFPTRHSQLMALLVLLAIILVTRLFVVTVFQHEKWKENADSLSTKTIYTTAPRGEIYDRNGKLLAGNRQSFSLRLSSSGQTNEELNNTISDLYKIMRKNGDNFVDNFPIKFKNGKYYYTYDRKITKWLKKEGFKTDLTAEEAFNALRTKLGIDPSLDRYAAQQEMQQTYNQFPPISVSDMKYTAQQDKERFLQIYFGDDESKMDLSAKEAFKEIREDTEIDPALSDKQARIILKARYELDSLGFSKYLPATIAKKLSSKTVMLIQEDNSNLNGVEVVSETNRYYPHHATASHILGYMGKINDAEKEAYEKKGYETSALVGKEGIEGKFESVLAGKNGQKVVQVNNLGQTQKVISETGAKKGKDMFLTIDLELQQTAEDILERTIKTMTYGGTVVGNYGNTPTEAAGKAKTGAVVAIEVDTGDVLAMASYPDYDPNLFANGISDKNWEKLQSTNPRDSLSPAPLYTLATMATVQPGSTFKPITATTGLQCGLNPYAYYVDGGAIKLGGTTFACLVWNQHKGRTHGALNLFSALEVSCNYYFYDVGTGKDWASGGSMGYSKKITIDKITKMAEQYGLGKPTGIEIDEAVVPVPTEERKIEACKTNLRNELYAASEEYFKKSVVKDSELLDKNIETIVGWLDSDKEIEWEELYNDMLPSVGVKKGKCQKVGEMFLFDYYPQVSWNTADAFNISIGQGENSYTPLQMANYVATLGNHGTHNQVSVVKAVQGQGNTKKAKPTQVKVDSKKYFDYIISGMSLVVNGSQGSLYKPFKGFKIKVAAKTGTAEKSGKINPKSEVDYIKSHLYEIAPSLSWSRVNKEMKRLMKQYPDLYTTEDIAVRRAVINLTNGRVTTKQIDAYKAEYEPFAWIVALAPADDPKIAVCAMVPQGKTSGNVAPIVKEVIGKYFDTKDNYVNYSMETVIE